MKILLIALLIAATCVEARCQDSSEHKKARIQSDTVYWLGLDLSQLKVYDYLLVTQAEVFKSEYCPYIIGFTRQKYPLEKVKQDYGKTTVIEYSDITLSSFRKLNTDSLVLIDGDRTMSFEDIQSVISGYDLNLEKGLGLVAMVPNVSRTKKQTTVVVIFFEISSRSIIEVFKAQSALSSSSSPDAYAKSVFNGLKECATKFQNKERNMSTW